MTKQELKERIEYFEEEAAHYDRWQAPAAAAEQRRNAERFKERLEALDQD